MDLSGSKWIHMDLEGTLTQNIFSLKSVPKGFIDLKNNPNFQQNNFKKMKSNN